MSYFDVIVLGTGGVGSAALYSLARRKLKVIGIDQFGAAHGLGSSHGKTRIIRQAYFEHADYVPLLKQAYQLWESLEERRKQQLFHQNGLLEVAPSESDLIKNIRDSADQYQIPLQEFSDSEANREFPGFYIPPGYTALFEPTAGYLRVEECVLAHLEEAIKCGAQLQLSTEVKHYQATSTEVTVTLKDGSTITAGALVIAAGAWAVQLLSDLQIPLTIHRKPLFWFQPQTEIYRSDHRSPCFFYEVENRYYYGFPQIDATGVKVAEHSGGLLIENPLHLSREKDPQEQQQVTAFVEQFMPQLTRKCTDHAVCMYTMTPDEHFLVDRHPQYPHVVFAAGLSGHGFKFTNILGEVMADWIVDKQTNYPVDFLSINRPRLRS